MGKLQIWTAVLRGGEYMEPVGFSEENEQERAAGENEHEEEMTGELGRCRQEASSWKGKWGEKETSFP